MHRDQLSSVTDLAHRLRQGQATLSRALTRASAVRDGTDESGTITILIDDEGTARDVAVATGWRRRLAPAQVGAAVVSADGDAARRRATAAAEALADTHASTADSWPTSHHGESAEDGERAAELGDGVDGEAGSGWPVPSVGVAGGAGRPRRSVVELSTAVLAAFEDLERVTTPPPRVSGAGADGAVHVTLDQGRITECTVNQAWLAHQDEMTLAHALREAIGAAATAGHAARQPLVEYRERLDAIVADARQSLNDHRPGPRR